MILIQARVGEPETQQIIFSDEIIIIEFRIIWSTVCPHSREIFHFLLYVSIFAVAQSLIHVRLFVSPRTAAFQAPLSSTISWSLLKFMSIESVMLFNHLTSATRFSFCLQSFSASGSFLISQLFESGASATASVFPLNVQG